MIKTILVALDRSGVAEQALPFAEKLASRIHASIVVATALAEKAPSDGWNAAVWQQSEEDTAASYLKGIEEGLQRRGIRTRNRVAWGDATETIWRIAQEEAADLVVMTTHGRSGIKRWLLGSVATGLLRISSRPVLLVRAEEDATSARPVRFERILVPLDGSAWSEAVLPLVNDLMIQLGASLVLQEVVLPITAFAGEAIPPTESVAEPAASAMNYLERIAQRERELGISVDIEVGIGATAEAIRYVAEQTGADLIALGTHSRSAPLRWLLGSVADELVRHSYLPCLVIPARAVGET